MAKYHHRRQAGQLLAEALIPYQDKPNKIVLALPRGGVPVAYEVAKRLHAPLDVFLVRKLGVPGYAELAMGAIAQGGAVIINQNIVREYQVTQEELDAITAREKKELARRELAYRGTRPALDVVNRTVFLVDDGIATGASMRVAIDALQQMQPKSIIVAVPVIEAALVTDFQKIAEHVVCPMIVEELSAVGAWYDDFSQTEDEEVRQLLSDNWATQ